MLLNMKHKSFFWTKQEEPDRAPCQRHHACQREAIVKFPISYPINYTHLITPDNFVDDFGEAVVQFPISYSINHNTDTHLVPPDYFLIVILYHNSLISSEIVKFKRRLLRIY